MVGGSVPLKVKFESDDSAGDVGYCWLARCDKPGNIDEIVEKAIKRKVSKLVRTQADKVILLLQREDITMGDTEILDLIEKFAPDYPDIAKVDEIWFANTSIRESEGWVYLSRLQRGSLMLSFRERAGLIHYERRDFLQPFEGLGVFHQHGFARPRRNGQAMMRTATAFTRACANCGAAPSHIQTTTARNRSALHAPPQ